MKMRSKMWSRRFVTFAALLLGASAVQADVLYSENFDGEGGAGAYDDGTTLNPHPRAAAAAEKQIPISSSSVQFI